jgi:hypothetical protein
MEAQGMNGGWPSYTLSVEIFHYHQNIITVITNKAITIMYKLPTCEPWGTR